MPNRALKNRRKPGASAEKTAGAPRAGNAIPQRTGRERPDKPTSHPADVAVSPAAIIKTNS